MLHSFILMTEKHVNQSVTRAIARQALHLETCRQNLSLFCCVRCWSFNKAQKLWGEMIINFVLCFVPGLWAPTRSIIEISPSLSAAILMVTVLRQWRCVIQEIQKFDPGMVEKYISKLGWCGREWEQLSHGAVEDLLIRSYLLGLEDAAKQAISNFWHITYFNLHHWHSMNHPCFIGQI